MRTNDDLVKLAGICLRQAREATDPALARELRSMAREYQQRAARPDTGQLPDIDQQSPDGR
jgi:hypothetical protein